MNTDEMANLDRRLSQVEASIVTLRHEITALDRRTLAFLKVQDLIFFGERSVAELKTQRAKLAAVPNG
jgi:hypothetical protein